MPAELPPPPSHPSTGHGDVRGGLVSWAGCPSGKQLWWHQGPPPAPSSEQNLPRAHTCRPAEGQWGWDTQLGTGWKVVIWPPGTVSHERWSERVRGEETCVHQNARLEEKSPYPVPCTPGHSRTCSRWGVRQRKSSSRKTHLKSSSRENPQAEGQGGHWRPDRGWQ